MAAPAQEMAGTEPGAAETATPDVRARPRPGVGDAASDWLCVWCLNRVASEADRFSYDGQSEFSFKNPEGVRFHLILFSRTLGGLEIGEPTLEHTWFSGHAWSFCVCDRCRQHLGWHYAGPTQFAGLIRGRIFRASLTHN